MPYMRKGCIFYTHAHIDLGLMSALMHGHAVARGLIGYINTNTSLEREEGKGAFCAHSFVRVTVL